LKTAKPMYAASKAAMIATMIIFFRLVILKPHCFVRQIHYEKARSCH
jgi:hypothetical protein